MASNILSANKTALRLARSAVLLGVVSLLGVGCPFDFLDLDPPVGDEDAPLGFIGSPCLTSHDCNYPAGFCLGPDDGHPNGMCTQHCDHLCPDRVGHPVTFCIDGFDRSGSLCHSRCDFGFYPQSGCRTGYRCLLMARSNEPGTQIGTCVSELLVDDSQDHPQLEPDSECLEWLLTQGVRFELTQHTPERPTSNPELSCEIEDPLYLHGGFNGVDFCTRAGSCSPMLVSCPLARALVEMSELMADYGLVEITRGGTYSCRVISGTDTLSQHALGLAIDIYGFYDESGGWLSVEHHWEKDIEAPRTRQGRILRELVYDLYEERVFNIILTPDYDRAHYNHFHLDLSEGSHFVKRGER